MASGFPDLHRHLDGSLRRDTLEALAEAEGISIPDDLLFFPNMGLLEALARFRMTLSVLQTTASVRRVAQEICEDAEKDNVSTLEIRFAPQLHQERGATCEAIVDAVLEGIQGRAGLILCGLFGEPPGVLESLVEIARARRGVVGIDLAGGPTPGHRFGLADYRPAFLKAKRIGLGRTVHAGEGRPAHEIRAAIETLEASRIGHGTTLLAPEEPDLVDLVTRHEITIEACPTSNVHTGVISSIEEHPIRDWLDAGVQVTVSTDNTLLSNVTATEEHRRVGRIPGIDEQAMEKIIEAGHRGAFPWR